MSVAAKKCPGCQTVKPLVGFCSNKGTKDGRHTYCKPCAAAKTREWNERRKRESVGVVHDDSTSKVCSGCNEEKPKREFHVSRTSLDGRTSQCSKCNNARGSAYLKNPANKGRVKTWRDGWRAKSPRPSLNVCLRGALRRCPTDNPITLDNLVELFERQGGRCALSGLEMTWARGVLLPTSITLDRIDPYGDYSKGNIRLLCHAVNTFRGRMTDAEMLTMARAIVANLEPAEPVLGLLSLVG